MTKFPVIYFILRGEEFREENARLGDVRSILSATVNIVALTATATKKLQEQICTSLKMRNPIVVSVSPDKNNPLCLPIYNY